MRFSNWLSKMKSRSARAGRARSGFSRRSSLMSQLPSFNAQFASAEVLEDRALLAAFDVSGSTLQVNLAASESLAITSAGSSYALALTGGTWRGTDGAGATGNGLTTLTATAAAFSTVMVDDSGASTAVTFNNSGANTYTSSILVTLDDAAAGTITFNGTTAFAGSAALSASTSKNIDVNSGALVSVVNGDLIFSANQQATPTDASFSGLQMDGTLTTSGSGDISLFGKGGNGGVNIGIAMSGGTVSSTAIGAGAGTVTLVGMSRGGSISFAIEAKGNSTVSSVSGNISITGTNDSFGGNNAGVYFQSGSAVRSTGEGANAANISITGTGQTGFGTDINEGVTFRGTNSGIFTVDGDVTIVGTGRTTSTEGDGISIKSSAIVRSIGDGNISLTGTGTPTGATASGILVSSGTIESTGSGAITVTGTGTTASGITLTSGTVGNVNSTVPVKLIADSMSIDGSSNILASDSGSVTIAPRTSGNSINLGGSDSAGTLGLSAVELARVQTGALNIGDVNTATINVTANITLPATTNVNLVASTISFSGNTISAASVGQTTAGQSDIVVQQPGTTVIASGGSREFGRVVVGGSMDLIFAVNNPGFVDLTGVNVTLSGADQADFSVTASPTVPVVPGGSTTFTVRFTPLVAGFKNAVLHIASNDPDESSFDINLSAVAADGFLSGIKSVGPTGDFSSIGAAISAIQTSVRSGPIVLELQPTYVSTGESFPLVFRYLGTTATDTLTIRPQAGATGLSISSADTTAATVDLNGAQFVTFDGRPGGVGTAKELTIENTSTAGVALRFINEASNNTLKFVTLKGVNTSATSGTVVFSTTTGANGNDNNTIDTCDIRDGASTPTNGIYSLGTATTAQNNSGNTVTNCNVFNFYAATAVDAAGVRLDGGNTDWTITGNSFYQTASRMGVNSVNIRGIFINNTSGNNFTVTGNFIGGDSPGAAVTIQKWTPNGSTRAYLFQGIRLNVGTTTASSVQGNTIANMVWRSNSAGGALPGQWSGIYVSAGNVNIGTVTGNTIGSGTGTGSISVTTEVSSTSFGIGNSGSGAVAIANNTIGSITVNGSNTTSIAASLVGIQVTAGANTISNNLVGSTTTANSLNSATSSTSSPGGQQVTGILSSSSTSASITGNTVANLNNNYASTGISGQIRGIFTFAGVNTITGNTVRNLSTTSQNTLTTVSPANGQSVVGIADTSSVAGQTVSQNTVHSLANTAASANVSVTGIYFTAAASSGHVIARNFVHSLAVSSTSTSSVLNGMQFFNGIFTAQNNLVRVGLDAAGTSTAGASTVRGIYDNSTTAGRNFYHNSVYVGGTQTSGASNTFAFTSTSATNTRDHRNNIFVNARTNGSGTGKHYAVNYGGTTANPTGLTASNNLFFVSGTGGVLGLFNSADRTTLPDWQTATGVDANSLNTDPLFVNPTGTATTVDLHLQSGSPAGNVAAMLAAVTNDFEGDLRSLTVPDIGADEFGAALATLIADQNATEDALFSFAIPSGTFSGTSLTYAATKADGSALPGWLSFDATTRTFSGTPTNADVGTLSVKVTATDTSTASVSDTFDIVVANTNDAPTLANALLDQNATPDAAFSFQFAADAFVDVDAGDSLTYSATLADGSALPGWLSFDATTRTFSGTPSTGDVGTLSVKVTATDTSTASVSDEFDIVVASLNAAPVFTSSDMPSVAENTAAVVALAVTDADNDTVSFSITGGADSAKFEIADVNGVPTLQFLPNPLAALIFQQTGVLIDPYADFENPGSAAGSNTYLVTVTADDGHGHMISQDLTVTVTNVNEKPKLLLATNSFNVPENTTAVTTVSAFDPDANTTLSYSLSGANAGSFSVSSSGEITFKFAPNFESDQTSYTFNVIVSDGELSDTQTITVSVNDVNDPPVIEAPSVSRQQGSPVSRSAIAYVYDDDGGEGDITVTVTSANPSNGVTISNIVNTDGIITADVIADSTATNASFTLQASDGVLTSTTTLNVTVTANTPPTLDYTPRAFVNKTVLDGLSGNQVNAIVVAGNTIYVGTGSNTNNGGLSISTDGGRTFVNKTTANGLGANTVNDISVNGNTVVVSHRHTSVFGYSISTDGGATFIYINGGSFFYSIAESGGTIYGGSNGVGIKITSDGGDNFETRTTADGLGDGLVRDLFVVGNTVYAATAGGLSISTDGGTTFVNRTTANGLGNNFVEGVFVVGNTVYAATFGGLSTSTDGGATFTNKTTADGLGDNWVHKVFAVGSTVVAATNGGLSVSTDGGTTFTNKTTADGLGNNVVNAAAATSGVLFAGTTAGLSFGTGAPPSDPVITLGDSLTLNPTSGPVDNGSISTIAVQSAGTYAGTISVDPATGVVSFSNAGPVGTHTITIRATDNSGATTDATFTLTVNLPPNSAPTLANSIPDQQASENNAFSFQFAADTFADADAGDSLSYSTSTLPSWLSFSASTRTFSGTPATSDVGSVDITVTATDGSNEQVSDTFRITVAYANNFAPVLADTTFSVDENAANGTSVGTVTATDADSTKTLSYSISAGNASGIFAINSATGEITVADNTNLVSDEPFPVELTVQVSDGGPGTARTDTAVVTINKQPTALVVNLGGSQKVVVQSNNGHVQVIINDVVASEFSSILTATLRSITINGGSGNNLIDLRNVTSAAFPRAGGLTVVVQAGAGNDTVLGSSFGDQISGGAGDDSLDGGLGNDSLDGGLNNDIVIGGVGNDTLAGGDGVADVLSAVTTSNLTLSPTQLTMGASSITEVDTFSGFEKALMLGSGTANVMDASAATIPVTLYGGGGNDVLIGSTAADYIDGQAGNDTLTGGGGNDALFGGVGSDDFREVAYTDVVAGQTRTITLTNTTFLVTQGAATLSQDSLAGFEFAEITGGSMRNSIDASAFTTTGVTTISGGGSADTILGSDGNDIIYSLAGADIINGNGGDDSIFAGSGNDKVTGGPGADTLNGQNGNDSLVGDEGDDALVGGADIDTLLGGSGNDFLSGQTEAGLLYGGDGNDIIQGNTANDTLYGEAGDDRLFGLQGDDVISGGDGADSLVGAIGNDSLYGDAGADTLRGAVGNDLIDGGADFDRINEEFDANVTIVGITITTASLGSDTVAAIERIQVSGGEGNNLFDARQASVPVFLSGGAGNDTLLGGSKGDGFNGGDGDDVISGGAGKDVIDGGDGVDYVYEKADTNFTVNGVTFTSTLTGTDTPTNVERIALIGGISANKLDGTLASVPVVLIGGRGNDTLLGGSAADTLSGGSRNDATVSGGDGTDSLDGGVGSDVLENDPVDAKVIGAGDIAVADVFALLPSWIDSL